MHVRKPKSFSLLEPVIAAFVGLILVSNIVAQKFISFQLSGITVSTDLGTLLLFPLTYIFGDVLTEVFGFAVSRRVIWYGFAMNALAALLFGLAVAMPFSPEFTMQKEFAMVLGAVPGLVIASLAGFWLGSFANDFVLARMKVWMVRWDPVHRWLALRTVASTLVGELLDTSIFVSVATVFGIFPVGLMASLIISQWLIKTAIETILTPVTIVVCGALKRRECLDMVGTGTWNPFAFGVEGGENLVATGQLKKNEDEGPAS
ncbi:MAG: queuosine precursor transporter [Spirochaetota bacterium]